jgi:pimeloyl-ACP methyl ester carboxylesterase
MRLDIQAPRPRVRQKNIVGLRPAVSRGRTFAVGIAAITVLPTSCGRSTVEPSQRSPRRFRDPRRRAAGLVVVIPDKYPTAGSQCNGGTGINDDTTVTNVDVMNGVDLVRCPVEPLTLCSVGYRLGPRVVAMWMIGGHREGSGDVGPSGMLQKPAEFPLHVIAGERDGIATPGEVTASHRRYAFPKRYFLLPGANRGTHATVTPPTAALPMPA